MTDPETDTVAAQNERDRNALRAGLDTNVPSAAQLSRNAHSPCLT